MPTSGLKKTQNVEKGRKNAKTGSKSNDAKICSEILFAVFRFFRGIYIYIYAYVLCIIHIGLRNKNFSNTRLTLLNTAGKKCILSLLPIQQLISGDWRGGVVTINKRKNNCDSQVLKRQMMHKIFDILCDGLWVLSIEHWDIGFPWLPYYL